MTSPSEDLEAVRTLRADLVSDAHRAADEEIAERVDRARKAGLTMTRCAELLDVKRQTLYALLSRIR
jgi:hypothetical protein